MKKDDTVFLRHILDAIARIEMYSQDVSYKQFMQTPLIQDGIIRNLEIIGEASRNMSGELRAQHPAVPWNRIIGLRNRITHGYFNIILDIV